MLKKLLFVATMVFLILSLNVCAFAAEVILYEHSNFQGAHIHLFNSYNSLSAENFNDRVSSFVITSGNWQFLKHDNYREPYSGTFGRGLYSNISDYNIPHDDMSSVLLSNSSASIYGDEIKGHVELYEHENYGGRHTHFFTDTPNVGSYFNDMLSSMIVVSGNVNLYKHKDYSIKYSTTFNGITKNPQSSRQLYQCICGLWKQRWYDTT